MDEDYILVGDKPKNEKKKKKVPSEESLTYPETYEYDFSLEKEIVRRHEEKLQAAEAKRLQALEALTIAEEEKAKEELEALTIAEEEKAKEELEALTIAEEEKAKEELEKIIEEEQTSEAVNEHQEVVQAETLEVPSETFEDRPRSPTLAEFKKVPDRFRREKLYDLYLRLTESYGYDPEDVEFAMDSCDHDELKCVNVISAFSEIKGLGYNKEQAMEGLLLNNMEKEGALKYLAEKSASN